VLGEGDTRISRDRSPRVAPWEVLRDLRCHPECSKPKEEHRRRVLASHRISRECRGILHSSLLFSTPLVTSLVVTPPRARSLAGSSDNDDDDDDDDDDDGGGGGGGGGGGDDERARSRRP